MLNLSSSVRVFVCLEPADMRRSFDGLSALVEQVLGREPLSGHLFVFRNRRGDRVKVLYWDRDGYALWYKRLERGVFRFPQRVGGKTEISAVELMLLLEGIEVTGMRRRKRYARREIPCNESA